MNGKKQKHRENEKFILKVRSLIWNKNILKHYLCKKNRLFPKTEKSSCSLFWRPPKNKAEQTKKHIPHKKKGKLNSTATHKSKIFLLRWLQEPWSEVFARGVKTSCQSCHMWSKRSRARISPKNWFKKDSLTRKSFVQLNQWWRMCSIKR